MSIDKLLINDEKGYSSHPGGNPALRGGGGGVK
jgi:hypothetical protein